jgi:hypothetical protein
MDEMHGANVESVPWGVDEQGIWSDAELSISGARAVIRYAVTMQRAPLDRDGIAAWVLNRFPAADPHLIEGLLVAATVNDCRRQHYPDPDDLLYRRDDGTFEHYDPSVHGRWARSGRPRLVAAPRGPEVSGAAASVVP